ncbi:hypothetical protein KCU92_g10222, partial [Aureobasidium melanogenum]
MSVEADTITYRFVENATKKSYDFVLSAETPSLEIKLPAAWQGGRIGKEGLVADIYLYLDADDYGSENFLWSVSSPSIKHDKNREEYSTRLGLCNIPHQPKPKTWAALSEEIILGDGDTVEFWYDFSKNSENHSKPGSCAFKVTIERSRDLPAELTNILQDKARFKPPIEDTLNEWRRLCEGLCGRPLSRARRADQHPLSQTSQRSQDEDTEGESNDPDARSHTDSGDHMEGPDEPQAPTPASSHQAHSDRLKRRSDTHTQDTGDVRFHNNEDSAGSTDGMRKRPRYFPDLAFEPLAETENTGHEGESQMLTYFHELVSVANRAKSFAQEYWRQKGVLHEVTTTRQTLKDRLSGRSTVLYDILVAKYHADTGIAIDESNKERQQELKSAALSRFVDGLETVNAPFFEYASGLNDFQIKENKIKKFIRELGVEYRRLEEQFESILNSQLGQSTVL